MKKLPKFFCEYCGTEVRQNDKVCPHCGRFFASVKCPSCGFAGDSRAFRSGCPVCGYAVNTDDAARQGETRHVRGTGQKKRGSATDPLPWWIYVLSLALLALVSALVVMNAG